MPRAVRRRVVTNPVESARQAGLTYVTEGRPGLTRHRAGRGFVYRDAAGRRVRDGATLARIRATIRLACQRRTSHRPNTAR